MKKEIQFYKLFSNLLRVSHKKLSDADKIILSVILPLCNKHGYAWVSNPTLALLVGKSAKTISRHCTALARKGFIEVEIINLTDRKIKLTDKTITLIKEGLLNIEYGPTQPCLTPYSTLSMDPTQGRVHIREVNREGNIETNREPFSDIDIQKEETTTLSTESVAISVSAEQQKDVRPAGDIDGNKKREEAFNYTSNIWQQQREATRKSREAYEQKQKERSNDN